MSIVYLIAVPIRNICYSIHGAYSKISSTITDINHYLFSDIPTSPILSHEILLENDMVMIAESPKILD